MRKFSVLGVALAIACLMSMSAASVASAETGRAGKWIQANHVMLRYEMSGAGDDVVVLIHDMGTNLEIWDEVVPQIEAPGRRILRYDMRGFGLSEKFRTQVTIDDHIEDLHALLDGLGLHKPVTLVGGSVGGAIALKFAGLYPDRVKAVVGINAVTRIKRTGPGANPNPGLLNRDTAKMFETDGVRAYLNSDLEWLYPKRLQTPERLNRFMGIEVAQDPADRAITMRMKNASVDAETELPKVRAPTLLIAGMINSSYTADEWKMIASAIPHAHLEFVQTAHHAAFESPELVTPLLKRFLDAHR